VVLGGEESAGLSVAGHVPDKDGILAGLLVAEMVARTGRSLAELTADLFRRVGAFHTRRVDLPVSPALRGRLDAVLRDPPPSFAGARVAGVSRLDGCKLLLDDGGWFLFRPSGTEPIVRCYGEARTPARLDALMEAGRRLVQDG
jgi:phosphoglucomutase